jgi:hypothetical protein
VKLPASAIAAQVDVQPDWSAIVGLEQNVGSAAKVWDTKSVPIINKILFMLFANYLIVTVNPPSL